MATTTSTGKPVTERHRTLALHHANLIQQRKDVEAQILAAIEELIDFPTSPDAKVEAPNPNDFRRFAELLHPFQASDYDDLIEERNAATNCGYVFCPKPLPRDNKASPQALRIMRTANATSDIKIVPSSKFEMWCSKDCAKRAKYIRMQLSELPAWERTEGAKNHHTLLSLLDDDASSAKTPRKQTDTREEDKRTAMTELARERGEHTARPILQPEIPQPRGGDDLESSETKVFPIRERVQVSAPEPPRNDMNSNDEIEGYVPKAQPKKPRASMDHDDDVEDTDWTF